MKSVLLWELFLFLHATGQLAVQNWNVYHTSVLYHGCSVVCSASILVLSLPLVWSQLLSVVQDSGPVLQPQHALLWSLVLAQLAGLAAYLFREVLQTVRPLRLVALVGLPSVAWVMWKLLMRGSLRKLQLTALAIEPKQKFVGLGSKTGSDSPPGASSSPRNVSPTGVAKRTGNGQGKSPAVGVGGRSAGGGGGGSALSLMPSLSAVATTPSLGATSAAVAAPPAPQLHVAPLYSDAHRSLRLLLWQLSTVAERSVLAGYVVGVLPPAFAADTPLYFDWARCAGFAASATVSTAVVLSTWALRRHGRTLYALWTVLGAWTLLHDSKRARGKADDDDEDDDGETYNNSSRAKKDINGTSGDLVGVRDWDSRLVYTSGARVRFRGQVWVTAKGCHYCVAPPGDAFTIALHFVFSGGLLRVLFVLLMIQLAVIAFHVSGAFLRAHFVADTVIAVLNLPFVFLLMQERATQR